MNNTNKIVILVSILAISTPAVAIQAWMLRVGKASSPSLAIALATDSKNKPPSKWKDTTKSAANDLSKNTDVSPYMGTAGFERIRVIQNNSALPAQCKNSYACATINRSKNIECVVNVTTKLNSKPSKYRKMAMIHELGHCYGLGHNTSRKEIMHPRGCPAFPHKTACGVTIQAKNVLARRY